MDEKSNNNKYAISKNVKREVKINKMPNKLIKY